MRGALCILASSPIGDRLILGSSAPRSLVCSSVIIIDNQSSSPLHSHLLTVQGLRILSVRTLTSKGNLDAGRSHDAVQVLRLLRLCDAMRVPDDAHVLAPCATLANGRDTGPFCLCFLTLRRPDRAVGLRTVGVRGDGTGRNHLPHPALRLGGTAHRLPSHHGALPRSIASPGAASGSIWCSGGRRHKNQWGFGRAMGMTSAVTNMPSRRSTSGSSSGPHAT